MHCCFCTIALLLIQFGVSHAFNYPNEAARCRKGQYYDAAQEQCVQCSVCPEATLVISLCWSEADTVCGHLNMAEFPFRNMRQSAAPSSSSAAAVMANGKTSKEKAHLATSDESYAANQPSKPNAKENATECFVNAKGEEILITGLICALVLVILAFISYIVVTKCRRRIRKSVGKDGVFTSGDLLLVQDGEALASSSSECEKATPSSGKRRCPADNDDTLNHPGPNLVIGPDGSFVLEEQYLRDALRALKTRRNHNKAPVLPSAPELTADPTPVGSVSNSSASSSSSTNSETSVTIDF